MPAYFNIFFIVFLNTVTSRLSFTYHWDRPPSLSPLGGSTPQGSLSSPSHSLMGRIHPFNQIPNSPLWRYLLTGPTWKPGRILFLSCCTLIHCSFFWGASSLLTDFKLFGVKKNIKIIFTGTTQRSYFVSQKLHPMHREGHGITYILFPGINYITQI